MQQIIEIARHELATQWRSHTLKVLLPLVIVLTALVAVTHWQQQQDFIEVQHQWQHHNDEHWQAQPDRHPHRAAHYGSMVFRTLSPLSFIESGVNPYVGNALFLEAHRQNSSHFKQYVSSTRYMGLGYLSGATMILVIWPLILIAAAFNTISGERMHGTLKLLMAQGITVRQLMMGKTLAFTLISIVFLGLVFLIGGLFVLLSAPDWHLVTRLFNLFGSYLLYCIIWSSLVVAVSTWVKTNQQSLSALLLVWLLMVIVLPKLAYSIAETRYPMPDRATFDIQTAQAIAQVGDSHNPDDPHFSAFREQVLAEYGVESIEALPVNWRGLVMQEGERVTSEVFSQQYATLLAQAERQNAWVTTFGWLSPYLLLSQLSQSLAMSDAASFHHYEQAAEDYRFALISQLNQLHVQEIDLAVDRDQKVSSDRWAEMTLFDYQAKRLADALPQLKTLGWPLLFWCFIPILIFLSSRNKVD